MTTAPKRQLGQTDIEVTPIALGCWPISGMTSLDVNDSDSLKTIEASLEAGVNFIDTAFSYGEHGESERLIAQVLRNRRKQAVLATKTGIHWEFGKQVKNCSYERIRYEVDESLGRLQTDYVDLLYVHAPDPEVPIAEVAGTMQELIELGKTRSVGVSNFNVAQMEEFAAVCPITACQPHYNMLQREIEADLLPWCRERQISVCVYWPLLKGLLAGKLARDHDFPPEDGRAKYPMFQGAEWQRNQDLVDDLRKIATAAGKTVAQLSIAWTIQQSGITCALVGAKRAAQARENAAAMSWELTDEQLQQIDTALAKRGRPVSRAAV